MMGATLRTFGISCRIVDRLTDRAHESRALVIHARSLEILRSVGVADELVRRGNTSTTIAAHLTPTETVVIPFGDIAAVDTEYPHILFISQAETEEVLDEHLRRGGQRVERGVEVTEILPDKDGVTSTLRDLNGRTETVRSLYVAGCDGAHSIVRRKGEIPFEGDTYPQTFVLGDVEVDGDITPDALNLFFGERGLAVFFPLGKPRTWRMIGISPPELGQSINPTDRPDLTLDQLQRIADVSVTTPLRLRDPDWLANFRLHHRQARRYRSGRLFLAGDAAHVHSPAGGQGMNTGLQDAWNLAWKLALVIRGKADDSLLDSYHAERWPVGRFLLRYTDRLFGGVARLAQAGPFLRKVRAVAMSFLLPRILGSPQRRARAFRLVSQLAIRYRSSPIVREGTPAIEGGPRAGDRFPDASVTVGGMESTLHRELSGPRFHLLLCGRAELWDAARIVEIERIYGPDVAVRKLVRFGPAPQLVDASGAAHGILSVRGGAQYLIRPDGYIAYRAGGVNLKGTEDFLSAMLPWAGASANRSVV